MFVFDEENSRHPHLTELMEHPVSHTRPYTLSANPLVIYSKRTLLSIKKQIPNPKFIVCIRDPIDRLVSHYNHQISLFAENRPVHEIISRDSERVPLNCTFNGTYRNKEYMTFSRYEVYLGNLIRIFGVNNIVLVAFNEIFSEGGLKRVKGKLLSSLGINIENMQIHGNRTIDRTIQIRKDPHFVELEEKRSKNKIKVFCVNRLSISGNLTGGVIKEYFNLSSTTLSWFEKAQHTSMTNALEVKNLVGNYFEETYSYLDSLKIQD